MWDLIKEYLSPVQIVGYLGTVCAIVSFQCKSNKGYFSFLTLCALFFAIQYSVLGSWSGLFINLVSVYRGAILLMGDRCRKTIYLASVLAGFLLAAVFTVVLLSEKWWIALILCSAQFVGTLTMWTRNGRNIRIAQCAFVSPMWIVNNVYYNSLGGVICELFNICSVIVSWIRFGKSGFDKN